MKNPKVTVLLPVYNAGKYFPKAIDSILRQTYSNFELLIVDDGSTDNSLEIARSFVDPRIRVIENKRNEGLIAKLNQGIDLSKGEYIARMDQDDISLPPRLEKQVKFMEKNINVGVCGTWIRIFYKIPQINFPYKPLVSSDQIKSALIFENSFQHPTIMLRSSFLKKNKLHYPSEFPFAEDYGFWVTIMDQTQFAIIPEILLHYRLHSTQIGKVHVAKQLDSRAKIHKLLISKLGIKVSENELIFHEKFCTGDYGHEPKYIDEVENWLTKLLLANNKSQIFNQQEFSKIIGDFWFKVCQGGTGFGIWIWNKYSRSSLASHDHLSLKQKRLFHYESLLIPFARPKFVKIVKSKFVQNMLRG